MAGKRGKQGGNTGSIQYSPARARKMQRKRRAQERAWAARSGPVTVTRINDDGQGDEPVDGSEKDTGGKPPR